MNGDVTQAARGACGVGSGFTCPRGHWGGAQCDHGKLKTPPKAPVALVWVVALAAHMPRSTSRIKTMFPLTIGILLVIKMLHSHVLPSGSDNKHALFYGIADVR